MERFWLTQKFWRGTPYDNGVCVPSSAALDCRFIDDFARQWLPCHQLLCKPYLPQSNAICACAERCLMGSGRHGNQ